MRPARVGYFFTTVVFLMSCHHSGRWYCVENRFKRPRPRGMLADGWPRMKRPVWLVGSGCPTWRGYRRVRTEGKSGMGHFCFFVLVFEAVEARSSCSHLSPMAAHRQISTLHISKKKTWTYYTSGGERNGILGNGGWSWVGLVGHHLGWEDCQGRHLKMMLECRTGHVACVYY